MKLPKIKFREMTVEENIENIKWMYFDNNGVFSIHDSVIQYFNSLANIDSSLSEDEIYITIENLITECYKYSEPKIKEEVKRYNKIWEKYNDIYLKALSKYLNIDWPSELDVIEASVGLIPVFPRYLDSFSFSLSTDLDENKVVEVTAHETLHFLWFEKWKKLYPNIPRREYDSPYITWKYSEMVTDPILNSKEIKSILNIDEKAYDSFYEINNGELMNSLKEIYKANKSIEEKIVEGFEYIKCIKE